MLREKNECARGNDKFNESKILLKLYFSKREFIN